jgi:hypothetical protein
MGDKMQVVMFDLKNWCGMPNVLGAIDGIHISIANNFDFLLLKVLAPPLTTHCCLHKTNKWVYITISYIFFMHCKPNCIID